MEKQLDRLIHTGQRIQGEPVSTAAFRRWRRAVLETLGRFASFREEFSRRCNFPQTAHVRNGLNVLHSAKVAHTWHNPPRVHGGVAGRRQRPRCRSGARGRVTRTIYRSRKKQL